MPKWFKWSLPFGLFHQNFVQPHFPYALHAPPILSSLCTFEMIIGINRQHYCIRFKANLNIYCRKYNNRCINKCVFTYSPRGTSLLETTSVISWGCVKLSTKSSYKPTLFYLKVHSFSGSIGENYFLGYRHR
jgi:hypothetical protein